MTGFDYTVSRVVDAPIETVWAVWTQDDHYEKFFHAVPGSVALDVRPGGPFKATMTAPDGSEHPMTGNYTTVEENRSLGIAMDQPGGKQSHMRMELAKVDGQTQITISQTCETAEEREWTREGSEMLLQWCADYLATL